MASWFNQHVAQQQQQQQQQLRPLPSIVYGGVGASPSTSYALPTAQQQLMLQQTPPPASGAAGGYPFAQQQQQQFNVTPQPTVPHAHAPTPHQYVGAYGSLQHQQHPQQQQYSIPSASANAAYYTNTSGGSGSTVHASSVSSGPLATYGGGASSSSPYASSFSYATAAGSAPQFATATYIPNPNPNPNSASPYSHSLPQLKALPSFTSSSTASAVKPRPAIELAHQHAPTAAAPPLPQSKYVYGSGTPQPQSNITTIEPRTRNSTNTNANSNTNVGSLSNATSASSYPGKVYTTAGMNNIESRAFALQYGSSNHNSKAEPKDQMPTQPHKLAQAETNTVATLQHQHPRAPPSFPPLRQGHETNRRQPVEVIDVDEESSSPAALSKVQEARRPTAVGAPPPPSAPPPAASNQNPSSPVVAAPQTGFPQREALRPRSPAPPLVITTKSAPASAQQQQQQFVGSTAASSTPQFANAPAGLGSYRVQFGAKVTTTPSSLPNDASKAFPSAPVTTTTTTTSKPLAMLSAAALQQFEESDSPNNNDRPEGASTTSLSMNVSQSISGGAPPSSAPQQSAEAKAAPPSSSSSAAFQRLLEESMAKREALVNISSNSRPSSPSAYGQGGNSNNGNSNNTNTNNTNINQVFGASSSNVGDLLGESTSNYSRPTSPSAQVASTAAAATSAPPTGSNGAAVRQLPTLSGVSLNFGGAKSTSSSSVGLPLSSRHASTTVGEKRARDDNPPPPPPQSPPPPARAPLPTATGSADFLRTISGGNPLVPPPPPKAAPPTTTKSSTSYADERTAILLRRYAAEDAEARRKLTDEGSSKTNNNNNNNNNNNSSAVGGSATAMPRRFGVGASVRASLNLSLASSPHGRAAAASGATGTPASASSRFRSMGASSGTTTPRGTALPVTASLPGTNSSTSAQHSANTNATTFTLNASPATPNPATTRVADAILETFDLSNLTESKVTLPAAVALALASATTAKVALAATGSTLNEDDKKTLKSIRENIRTISGNSAKAMIPMDLGQRLVAANLRYLTRKQQWQKESAAGGGSTSGGLPTHPGSGTLLSRITAASPPPQGKATVRPLPNASVFNRFTAPSAAQTVGGRMTTLGGGGAKMKVGAAALERRPTKKEMALANANVQRERERHERQLKQQQEIAKGARRAAKGPVKLFENLGGSFAAQRKADGAQRLKELKESVNYRYELPPMFDEGVSFDEKEVIVVDTCALMNMTQEQLQAVTLKLNNIELAVPFLVIAELDGINKNRFNPEKAMKAKQVREWVLQLQENSLVRVQRRDEVDSSVAVTADNNDDRILAFAVFVHKEEAAKEVGRRPVRLLTDDRTFKVKGQAEGLTVISSRALLGLPPLGNDAPLGSSTPPPQQPSDDSPKNGMPISGRLRDNDESDNPSKFNEDAYDNAADFEGEHKY